MEMSNKQLTFQELWASDKDSGDPLDKPVIEFLQMNQTIKGKCKCLGRNFCNDRCTGGEKKINEKEAMVDKLWDTLLRDFQDLWQERVSNIK